MGEKVAGDGEEGVQSPQVAHFHGTDLRSPKPVSGGHEPIDVLWGRNAIFNAVEGLPVEGEVEAVVEKPRHFLQDPNGDLADPFHQAIGPIRRFI